MEIVLRNAINGVVGSVGHGCLGTSGKFMGGNEMGVMSMITGVFCNH